MLNSDNQEMTSLLNKVEQYLQKNSIYCTKTFLKNKIELFKNIPKLEEKILEVIKTEDIENFIDKEKMKSFKLSESCKFDIKKSIIKNNLLFQIDGYSNIAEPLEKVNKANEANENLDETDNFESNYLQGDGEENVKQTEKVILKIKLINGVDTLYGFEYEELTELKRFLTANKENKFVKIIVGPEIEVRRGIFYLSQKNVKLI
jgi:hypothetical protein